MICYTICSMRVRWSRDLLELMMFTWRISLEQRGRGCIFGAQVATTCLRRMIPIQIGISNSFDTWHRETFTDTV